MDRDRTSLAQSRPTRSANTSARNRPGFTLIELLVVIAIIAILAAILFPVFANAKRRGLTITCGSNLQQIAKAVVMYTNDHNGFVPRVVDLYGNGNPNPNAVNSAWLTTSGPYRDLESYIKSAKIFQCPGPQCDLCYQNGKRLEVDYRFNEQLNFSYSPGKRYMIKKFDQCTYPNRFYIVSDRHSRHHYERNAAGQNDWVMVMVMADGHLALNVKPYNVAFQDSRPAGAAGKYKYDHWDFPSCHADDAKYMTQYY